MSTQNRKYREQEQRRNQILDAAESVIDEKGFDNATMDEIANKAELSKGTLYIYFSNKSDLHFAITKRGLKMLRDAFQQVLMQDRHGIDLIRQLGDVYVTFITENPMYAKALIYYESFSSEQNYENQKYAKECEEMGRQILMYLTRSLQIGMHDGTITHSMDPQVLAVQIWASMRGLIQLHQARYQNHLQNIMDDFELDLNSMINQFIEVLVKGIQIEESTQ